jgi:hypothetical protein
MADETSVRLRRLATVCTWEDSGADDNEACSLPWTLMQQLSPAQSSIWVKLAGFVARLHWLEGIYGQCILGTTASRRSQWPGAARICN